MSKREMSFLLEDILDAIQKMEDYTIGLSKEKFESDVKTIDAVVRNLEIIGEAANNISKTYRESHTSIDWHQIIGIRHRIIHEYFDVDVEIIWHVVQKDIPKLKTDIQKIINDKS